MRLRIVLQGVVQGVGFRPFVKKLADRRRLNGITFNTASGLVVEIESDTENEGLAFVEALRNEAPQAARIERVAVEHLPGGPIYSGFQITPSAPRDRSFTLTSPDLTTCPECLAEIFDRADRRFQYPFTNCTNCGPRYTITVQTPYDRINTTMSGFPMCAACNAEYGDVSDRRFHAEPIACPVCGPRLSMELSDVIAALEAGRIVAIKGLGGFQLACDAFNSRAVEELRARKRRSRKPFAVMMRDLATIERYCTLTSADSRLLLHPAGPVTLLAVRGVPPFPSSVAPGLRQLGVMLPSTPLHHLLLARSLDCLVMTSGNISEEPIVIRNEEAVAKLASVTHTVLAHDRDVFMRVDDSVARTFEGAPRILRRARGYAPGAITLAHDVGEVLATGSELKNTFCVTKGRYAILSQHIGDLENYETLQFFEETLRNLQTVYQAEPQLIAHDLHPGYLSTRWAMWRAEPKIAVQHHHAHIASCMAENGVTEQVIGVAFDGAGWGSDDQVWGGEFLLCDYYGYRRYAHLRYVALPGGDSAARQGWRMAAAYLYDAFGPDFRRIHLPCWSAINEPAWRVLDRMLAKPALHTSSCGRLFDAVAAICGISSHSSYEGESAMLLEAAAETQAGEVYGADLDMETVPWTVDTRGMMRRIALDVAAGCAAGVVSRCFHRSVAIMIESVSIAIRERSGVNRVCLSGGVFQNFLLLSEAASALRRSGFEVLLHSQVPPNDGGISLGQAVIAAAYLEKTGPHVPRNSR